MPEKRTAIRPLPASTCAGRHGPAKSNSHSVQSSICEVNHSVFLLFAHAIGPAFLNIALYPQTINIAVQHPLPTPIKD